MRAIVAAARRLGRGERASLDARLGATVAQRGGLDGSFDPDQLVDAVAAAVDDLDEPAGANAPRPAGARPVHT